MLDALYLFLNYLVQIYSFLFIFSFVYFFLVLVVTIMIIIANSGDTLEKSKVIKDKENEANIDELNKKLKE